MSGLLALLDDVAALTKLAAAQMDDIAAQTAKAGSKAVGVVIDDAAVTPKYVQGLPAARELPIVWKIARASLFNKLVILLPVALLLGAFAPWALPPLLMIGGAYLCYEGAEKILHLVMPHEDKHHQPETLDAAHLEEQRVAGAIKTDFILSAEIMAIALASIESRSVFTDAAVLATISVAITALVYGTVALLVKADDIGLQMSQTGRLSATRSLGRGIVQSMPFVMSAIAAIGTAAMLWVGGSIIVHSLAQLGFPAIEQAIYGVAGPVKDMVPAIGGFAKWLTVATLDGIWGLIIGLLLIPVVGHVLVPILRAVMRPAKG